jgi:PhzF family phenazine biosynthesis protein
MKGLLTIKIPYYHINAFASIRFAGNPAGAWIFEKWLPNESLQKIAFENNLSETAFLLSRQDHFELRWFTPAIEVDLCGHATLAAAFVVFKCLAYTEMSVRFQSKSVF